MINTAEPQKSASDAQNEEVSWYSIFWALFAIALQSMSLPSRMDTSNTSTYLLYAVRASPFICVTDAIEIIIYMSIELLYGASPRLAAAIVCSHADDDWRGDCYNMQHVEKSSIRQSPKASLIIFVGVLTQIIKLFGYQILTWPEVIAGMYAAPFALQAGLVLVADPIEDNGLPVQRLWERRPARVHRPLNAYFSWTLFVYCCVVSLIVSSVAINRIFPTLAAFGTEKSGAYNGLWWTGKSVTIIILLVAGTMLASALTFAPAIIILDQKNRYSIVYSLCVTVVGAYLVFELWYNLLSMADERPYSDGDLRIWTVCFPSCFGIALLIFTGVIFVTWILTLLVRTVQRLIGCRVRRQQQSHMVGIAFAHLVVAVLYGTYGYDSKGTIKPAWTDKLG